jgi:hypothetical protein
LTEALRHINEMIGDDDSNVDDTQTMTASIEHTVDTLVADNTQICLAFVQLIAFRIAYQRLWKRLHNDQVCFLLCYPIFSICV